MSDAPPTWSRATSRRRARSHALVPVLALLMSGVATGTASAAFTCALGSAPAASGDLGLGQPQVCVLVPATTPAPPTADAPPPGTPGGDQAGPLPPPDTQAGVLALPSVPRGPVPAEYAYGRRVEVGALTQSLLDAAPEGTVFALDGGTHRLTAPLRPRPGQALIGLTGAVLSGAAVVSGWSAVDGAWYADGITWRLPVRDNGGLDVCEAGSPLCEHPEDLFLDDVPLRQVGSRAEVGPGTFWLDRSTSRLWTGSDPTGRRAETTRTTQAVVGRDVLVRDLVVEKFGNAAQTGALHGHGLRVERTVVRLNHGTGVFSHGGRITDSVIADNGQLGLGAGGAGQLVEDNEIARNGRVGFDPGWEAGGTKWAHSSDLVVRSNWSHHNAGNGLWTDIDNTRSLYEHNLVEDNAYNGIFHEISHSATIRGNVVRRNGTRDTWFNSRVGINVTNSRDVTVHDNLVQDNRGGGIVGVQDPRLGGSGPEGSWQLERLVVRDNVVRMRPSSRGAYSGMWIYDEVPDRASYYTSRGNVFLRNSYTVPDPDAPWFLGGDTLGGPDWVKRWSRWQALGGDAGGSLQAG